MNNNTRHNILLVEDNAGDRILAQKAFQKSRHVGEVLFAESGEEALEILSEPSSMPRPELILLDLNLPKASGLDVLRTVKHDERLLHIPVIIFSSSRTPEDVKKSYQYYANSYMVKPKDLEEYQTIIEAMDAFWLSAAMLPSSC